MATAQTTPAPLVGYTDLEIKKNMGTITPTELIQFNKWDAFRAKELAKKAAKKSPEARLARAEKKDAQNAETEARLAAKFYNQPANQAEIVRISNLCRSAGKTRIQALANVLTIMGYSCNIWENRRIYLTNRAEADFTIFIKITDPTSTDWISPIDNGFNCVVINEFKATYAKSLSDTLNGAWGEDEFGKRGLTYSLFKANLQA